jgi:hypothetical protein
VKDLVLTRTVCYFGRIIRRGSVFKKVSGDWYILTENDGGIVMECPAVKLHFTSVDKDYFVEMYGEEKVRQEKNNDAPITPANSSSDAIFAELEERRHAAAELAGTNSCVDDTRKALLFMKHRLAAQDLQRKYCAH